ncbi:MAG TPA: c-type cytochrome [Reyranella sp.]|nr:c-type cytochrome [Reyranella sp.]
MTIMPGNQRLLAAATMFTAVAMAVSPAMAQCAGDNGGLTLAPGFCATVFADNLGHVRHMVVAPDGTLYATSWGAAYYRPTSDGAFQIALRDTTGAGRADVVRRFGASPGKGGAGGTGIGFHKSGLYVEEKDRILRYELPAGQLVPTGEPSVVVSGLPITGNHPMHPFGISARSDLFVDLGSITNVCNSDDPCTEKKTRAGIWRYDADKTGQVFSARERYASGLRNGEGFAFDAAGRAYVTQHGRDQLQGWQRFYTLEQGAELPAEEVVELKQGADYGWPECYYDQDQKKLVLAPEYGGNGGKKVGLCAERQGPVAAFPGHWAPNDLAIYLGTRFPAAYRGGLFVAFHGSWNRAPLPQGGYNVVFQPMADGKTAGPYIVFADGFAGAYKEPGRAAHRPTGLAVAPDGALFISDDVKGRIWRVTYQGGSSSATGPAQVSAPPTERKVPLPIPPGSTAEQVAAGDRLYHAQACIGCHGSDGAGTPVGPPLKADAFAWSDGSVAGIASIIEKGVPKPKRYRGAMPPSGGAQLSKEQLAEMAAYVWALSHANNR